MQYSNLFLIRGLVWTTIGFGFNVSLRLINSVVLARLLAPELFGVMVIVNSVRTGLELISDVGIGQNIVHNPSAENAEFYDTAWTLRIIRSVLLWLVCLAAAIPVAHFYNEPIFISVLPIAGLYLIITALGSVAPFLAQKKIRFVRLNIFEAVFGIFATASQILIAFFMPTIWALVFGGLLAAAAHSAGSYLILPEIRHRVRIVARYTWQIFSFGRWVFISSIAYFLSMNFDRLYFGKVAALGLVGVYGIARTLSDLVGSLILRLCNDLVFPLVAASQSTPRAQLRKQLAAKRLVVLLFSAVVFAGMISIADIIIRVMYDQRYQAAGWMLPILLFGSWFSMISSLHEATLMGFGKPLYSAVANGLKSAWFLIGFPIGFAYSSVLGVIVVVATGDVCRYVPMLIGQVRERFSFIRQDLLATLVMLGLVALGEWLRWRLGFGTSLNGLLGEK